MVKGTKGKLVLELIRVWGVGLRDGLCGVLKAGEGGERLLR